MGTHPIFESDFDCLTEKKTKKMSAPAAKKQKLQVYEDEVFEAVNKVQEQLEQVNEKASEEILKVEQRYNKQRRPLFASRQAAIEKLDKSAKDGEKFWARALANHPFLAPMMSVEELKIMSSLTKIEVDEDEDIKSGFTIRFEFAQNEHFNNGHIEKKFHIDSQGQ